MRLDGNGGMVVMVSVGYWGSICNFLIHWGLHVLLYNWGGMYNWSSNILLYNWSRDIFHLLWCFVVSSHVFTLNLGLETVVFVSAVVHDALVTIGINQTVVSLNIVTVTHFLLALDVSGVAVMDSILKAVLSWCLVFHLFDQSFVQNRLVDSVLELNGSYGGHKGEQSDVLAQKK